MPEFGSRILKLRINECSIEVVEGTTVAAAMLNARVSFRSSVRGEPRSALCGMGTCFECRAIVDGVPQTQTCRLACREGMHVETQP